MAFHRDTQLGDIFRLQRRDLLAKNLAAFLHYVGEESLTKLRFEPCFSVILLFFVKFITFNQELLGVESSEVCKNKICAMSWIKFCQRSQG